LTLIELKKSEDGSHVLRIPAQSRELSTVTIGLDGVSELALEDGTVWKDALTSPVAGVIVSEGTVALWHISLKLTDERLGKLATTRVINARVLVGDTSFGGQWFLKPWTDDLQRAAACMVHMQQP
jgi:hypothetical protein